MHIFTTYHVKDCQIGFTHSSLYIVPKLWRIIETEQFPTILKPFLSRTVTNKTTHFFSSLIFSLISILLHLTFIFPTILSDLNVHTLSVTRTTLKLMEEFLLCLLCRKCKRSVTMQVLILLSLIATYAKKWVQFINRGTEWNIFNR